jgi:FtsP/CotA-like multicopper oxidase with cupredoxin domain
MRAVNLTFLALLFLALAPPITPGRPPPRPEGEDGRPPRPKDGDGRPPRPEDGDSRPPRPEDEDDRPPRPEDGDGRPPRPGNQFVGAVTCDKKPTGQGGFGISSPCGNPVANPAHLSQAFSNPRQVTSVGGVAEMVLRTKIAVLNATEFFLNARRWCFVSGNEEDCSLPSPTIVVKPGDLIRVTIHNDLEEQPSNSPMNELRNPNSTNLHTHGLHVDPAIDNVMIEVPPGGSHTWEIEIPDDHHPGFHWYHSHLHGASTYHVQTGSPYCFLVEERKSLGEKIPRRIDQQERRGHRQ